MSCRVNEFFIATQSFLLRGRKESRLLGGLCREDRLTVQRQAT